MMGTLDLNRQVKYVPFTVTVYKFIDLFFFIIIIINTFTATDITDISFL